MRKFKLFCYGAEVMVRLLCAIPLLLFALSASAAESLFFTPIEKQNLGRGVGYSSGYTTLGATLVPPTPLEGALLLDVGVHHFDRGGYAANAGVGFRLPDPSIGFNAFYDYRSSHHFAFHQLGAGFELLKKKWRLSLNGYLPIGHKRRLVTHALFDDYEAGYFIERKKYESGLKGADLYASYRLCKIANIALFLTGGPYFYSGPWRSIVGGRALFGAKWKEYLNFSIGATSDTTFNTRMQGEVAFKYPLGKRPKKRVREAILRSEIIALDRTSHWRWNY